MQLSQATPEELTSLIHGLGWLPTNQQITELKVAGEGNMNTVVRAVLDPPGSIILKQSLPYVAKFPDIEAPIERISAEHGFYTSIADSAASEKMPALLGYHADAALLCFEDLGEGQDFSFLYQREEGQQIPTSALLNWLSVLHGIAAPVTSERTNLQMGELNHEHIFALPFRPDNGLTFGTAIDHFKSELLSSDLIAAASQLGEVYLGRDSGLGRKSGLGRDSGNFSHCILHGDFYPGSWLEHKSGEVKIIDPEFTFVGPGEFDVGVFLAHLAMCGVSENALTASLTSYDAPDNFNLLLAWQFAGVEIIRRILGVAQVPLRASDSIKIELLKLAKSWVLNKADS